MKALGCAALAVVVLFGGFFAVAAFVVTRGDDQSALTERVTVTVIDPRETYDSTTGSGYAFDYAYEHDGTWYGGDDSVADDYWAPGTELRACIDPGSPARHVLTYRAEKCGQESIVSGSVLEGTERPAP